MSELFRRKHESPTPGNTSAILLAGGRSSRFGENKAFAVLSGRTLLQWAVQLAAAVSARTVLSLGPDADANAIRTALGAPTDPTRTPGLVIAHDPTPFRGPVIGVRAALEHVETPFVVLLAVDMPLLRPDLVLGLMERLVGHDAVAWHLDGWWRPFPSLWRAKSLREVVARAERENVESLHGILDMVDARPLGREFLSLFDADGETLSNVNTRDELAAVERRLGQ